MDTPPRLSSAVQELIRDRVRSVEELEVLLLLRSQPARWWTDGEVAASLGTGVTLVRSALAELVANELCLQQNPGPGPTRFGPASEALAGAVAELAELYNSQRVEVLVFIAQSAISRVRTDAVRTFAEAFRFSKRKPDG